MSSLLMCIEDQLTEHPKRETVLKTQIVCSHANITERNPHTEGK
uniref:Uncharacterized protein n=1 Tax=Anguilla anguilla TaxID=7936 RepID=A0A0E9W3V8_ANGAN